MEKHYDLGSAYLDITQYNEAIVEFEKAINNAPMIDPMYTKVHCGLARAYIGLGKLEEAKNLANEALRLDTNHQLARVLLRDIKQAHLNRGKDYLKQNELVAAEKSAREALRLGSSCQETDALLEAIKQAYYNRGRNHLDNQRYDEAIAAFKKTRNKYPSFTETYCGLGWAYLRKNNLVMAGRSVRPAYELDPNSPAVLQLMEAIKGRHCEIGRNYLNQGNLSIAEESANETLKLDENYQPALELLEDIRQAYYNQGLNCIAHGTYTDAVNFLQKAKEFNPNDKKIHTNLGLAYHWMDDHDNAARCSRTVTTIDPDDKYAYINLGNSYYRMGAYQKGINSLQKAKEIDPNYKKTHYYLARVYFGLGELEKARRELEQVSSNTLVYKLFQTVEQEIYNQGRDNSKMVLIPTDKSEIALRMDKSPVTNAQYKKFLDENQQWSKDSIDKKYHDGNYLKHWDGNVYPTGKGNDPVVYVSWYAAMAYARWVNGYQQKQNGRKHLAGLTTFPICVIIGNGVVLSKDL